ncbi:hypothetical protein DV738_g3496, partial [Chaetothyriales sp. CBS 135597]
MSPIMPQSTLVQQSPNPPPKQQKLKFACDACARLKISCPKQQPECERCVSRGRRCVYSPACRLGKRKSTQSTAAAVVKEASKEAIPSPPESRSGSSSVSLSAFPESRPSSAAVNMSSIAAELPDLPAEKISAHPWDLTNGLPFSTTRLQEAFAQLSEQPVTVEPSETLLHGSYPYQELSMFQFQDSGFSPPSVSSSSWPTQQTSPLFTSESSCAGDSLGDSTPWSGSSRTSASITGQVETGLGIGDAEAGPQLLHSGSHSVDKILFNTDRAIEHVACVIQCACHTMSSVRCALALTLFEVIAWYEIIIQTLNRNQGGESGGAPTPESNTAGKEYQDSRNGGDPSNPSSPSSSEPSSLVSIPTVRVGTMRLQRTEANSVLTCLMRARIGKVH